MENEIFLLPGQNKLKKIKEKYKDQDEEDRELMMQLLGVRKIVDCRRSNAAQMLTPDPFLPCSLPGQPRRRRTEGRKEGRGKGRRSRAGNHSRNRSRNLETWPPMTRNRSRKEEERKRRKRRSWPESSSSRRR